jgi:hypothetical protein
MVVDECLRAARPSYDRRHPTEKEVVHMQQSISLDSTPTLDLGIEELDELVDPSWYEWAAGFAAGVAVGVGIGVLVAT